MLIAVVLAIILIAVAVGVVYRIGDGDLRRGRLRSIRRIRTLRRRRVRPLLHRLDRGAVRAWARPVRHSVERHVRQIADRIERLSVQAEDFVAAQHHLDRGIERLEELTPPGWRDGGYGTDTTRRTSPRKASPWGWLGAVAVGLAGAALGAGNGYLLYRWILPSAPALAFFPAGIDDLTLALAFAALPFLFGIAYFALYSAGEAMPLRLLAALTTLLVLAVGVLEGGIAVLTVVALGMADPNVWEGVATAAFAGGTAALLPPLTAVLAHRGALGLARWSSARRSGRDQRTAGRQDELAAGLRDTLARMRSAMETLRSEVQAIGREPAGRLLLQPDGRHSVERASAVLRRLAASLDRDADDVVVGRTMGVTGRFLVDVAVLGVWLLTAAGALGLAAEGLRLGAGLGVTRLMTAAAFAAVIALLVGGYGIRRLYTASGIRFGPGGRVAAVLVLAITAVSASAIFGSLAAAADIGLLAGRPLMAAAWLNLLILVAAGASTRLPDGISAVAGLVAWFFLVAARLVLTVVDLVLLVFDRALGGRRRPGPPRRWSAGTPSSTRAAPTP